MIGRAESDAARKVSQAGAAFRGRKYLSDGVDPSARPLLDLCRGTRSGRCRRLSGKRCGAFVHGRTDSRRIPLNGPDFTVLCSLHGLPDQFGPGIVAYV